MPLTPALRAKREATVLEHMGAENAHEFERCIEAFSHARYEIVPTGEIWDGKDGVNTLLLQNKTAFPDFKWPSRDGTANRFPAHHRVPVRGRSNDL